MKVTRVMTRAPHTVAADAKLDEAMSMMDGYDLRHLPVLDGEELVGVISDRDLLEATGWLYSDRRRDRCEPSDEGRMRTVRDVMRSPPVTVNDEDSVFTVAVKFVVDKIGCLPVLSKEGALVGIVTEVDLMEAYEEAYRGGTFADEQDTTVSAPMTGNPVTVQWDTPLSEAIEISRRVGVRHLPVLEGDVIVGLVSDRDLRKARGLNRVDETMMDEIMTRDVVTISPDYPMREAAQTMNALKIGALPVVADETLIGIVSVKDLVYHCMSNLRELQQST